MAGVASAVPANTIGLADTAAVAGVSLEEAEKIAKMTGVRNRPVVPPGMCTSDLAYSAAVKLLEELGWEARSIDALVFVSQTHDYDLPATACCLQERLGIPKSCAAFDMALGCSGYIYGLWVCSTFMAAGSAQRTLLLAGDTASRTLSPQDRATVFIFGDSGTATALERDDTAPPMSFVLGTDGSGRDYLILPGTGYRNCVTAQSLERRPGADGVLRSPLDLYMDGSEVFAFTLREVPGLVNAVLSLAGWKLDQVDAFVPHQANLFMLQHLGKRMKIPTEKLIVSLDEYGNTSSASIPLAMNHRLASRLSTGTENLILAGFGVGWSWGALAVTCGPMAMPDILVLDQELAVAG
jgi:3-oxoacyl-[acyl-carrier-protein] synthase-3